MHSWDALIDLAIAEDLGPGDITTEPIVGHGRSGTGVLVAKEPMVVAGLDVARAVFRRVDPAAVFTSRCADGERAESAATLAVVEGTLTGLLTGERTALNFLQRLSGVATLVRRYADAIAGSGARLVDTRKTTPGWRTLEKYAVRMGGGQNHRMGLYDGVLIKDNHIAVAGGIAAAVKRVRRRVSHLTRIEVEVTSMEEVRQALSAGVEVIMLDNMNLDQVREAVSLIAGKALVEVSGNVTLENLPSLAFSGVDIISVGALTHSARAVDISMAITP
jgi:nicotinate-nucleotide pyrophosphorylase (carboxylating)